MWSKIIVATAALIVLGFRQAHAQSILQDGFQECLAKDSISCIQMQIFRKARDFFAQDKIELLGGIALTKSADGRSAKSSDNVLADQHIEKATDVEDREVALESYLWNKAQGFMTERSITWNPSETARSLANSIPENVKEDINNLVFEGRGKKKQLKRILPLLLIGFKMKMVGLLILGYLVIALIAKKAILASLVSIAISGFIGLKKLLSKHDHVEEAQHGGWAPSPSYGGGWGGEELYGSHSQPVAQHLAYNGQKHK